MKRKLFILVLIASFVFSTGVMSWADTPVYGGLPGGTASGDIIIPSPFTLSMTGLTASLPLSLNASKQLETLSKVNFLSLIGALPLAGGTMTGHLLFTDNTYDIGASGATRPRTGYFGTSVVTPSATISGLTGGGATSGYLPFAGTGGLLGNSIMQQISTTNVQLGTNAADNSAVTQTIQSSASTTDVAGAKLAIQANKGSGTTYAPVLLQPSGGNVSIGHTGTPLARIDISAAGGNSTNYQLITRASGDPTKWFTVFDSQYSFTSPFRFLQGINSTTPVEFWGLYGDAGTGANPRMVIANNLGIGIGSVALGTSAAKVLGIGAGTAPGSVIVGGQLWTENLNGASTAGFKFMNQAAATPYTVMGVGTAVAVSTGVATTLMGSANIATNAGWLPVLNALGVVVYIPYWASATP